MTFTTDDITRQSLRTFQSFDADTQLALLWFGYLDIKDQLTPGNTYSSEQNAAAIFDQIRALPHDQQLQAQRDIVSRAETPISRLYGSTSTSSQLEVWLRLAQGMEEGTIIPMPADYQLPEATHEFVEQIRQLGFEQRINFMRSAVIEMGVKER